MLIRIQTHEFPGDQALIRQEQSRAYVEKKACAAFGRRPLKKAEKLLAQNRWR